VNDTSGAILPGATVTATSPSLVGIQTAVSDDQGNYRFPVLTPGVYEISASMQGFTIAKVPAVRLQLGQVLKIDLTLALATLTETVQVTAESPIIDVKQNAAASTITAEVIERIPKARDFTDLVKTAPGTQQERPASDSTGSPKAAPRCRPRCARRASRSIPSAAATSDGHRC
jgi:hypothetical protein